MIKQKTKSRLKRTLSGVLALAMTASVAAVMPAAAEETAKYPYAVFAADNDAGITINTDNFTLNGSAYTRVCLGQPLSIPISTVLLQILTILQMKTIQREKKPKMYLM